jgi:2-keto-4-pentenoate hydratase
MPLTEGAAQPAFAPKVREAARFLAEARKTGNLSDHLPETCRPHAVADAHAIQLATAALLDDTIVGWKVAATPEGQNVRGGLLRSRIFEDRIALSPPLVPLLGVEAEIAFRFDCELAPRDEPYTYEEVRDAVTAFPAIEVVDSRFRGYPNAPFLDRLADFMSNGAFVQGALHPDWRGVDLAALDAELLVDGTTVVRKRGGHPTKDPLLPAVTLVNELRSQRGISQGTVVTTGTYTGLNFAKPGQAVTANFHGFGSVSLRFEGR